MRELPEPTAWLHRQGNFTEAAERRLDDYEIARGWTEEPLYTADQVRQAVAAAMERAAQICEELERETGYAGKELELAAAAIRNATERTAQ